MFTALQPTDCLTARHAECISRKPYEFEPQGFLCTDPDAEPLEVLRWFIRRWSVEVTFAEVRRHLGVETQRDFVARICQPIEFTRFSYA